MPDTFGRLTLLELRQYILRNLVSFQPVTVDLTSGAESGTPLLGTNTQFSADNLNLRINSSTTKLMLLINANSEKIFAKELFYDAVPGVLQYALPPDFCQMRGLWWLPPGQTQPTTVENYVPMSYQDVFEDGPVQNGLNVSRPTWRLVDGYIQLNQDPADFLNTITAQGIMVRYIKWIQFLSGDTAVFNLPYAQVAQEVVAWDVTLDCIRTQEEMVDTKGIEQTLGYWNAQLEILIRNQYRPPEIRLIGPSMVKATFSGR